jgi:putative DNA primase/helicase
MGFSPLPPREDGTKAPIADVQVDGRWTWIPYQTNPATEDRVRSWYRDDRTGVGVVGGVGGLEPFEFDDRLVYEAFKEIATAVGLGDLVNAIEAGYCEETPGGGIHWMYVCEDVRPPTKLAERPVPGEVNKRDTLIETKGQGGFMIVAPSHGKVHEIGRAYRLLSGGPETIVTITPTDRDDLWDLARSFDEIPKAAPAV